MFQERLKKGQNIDPTDTVIKLNDKIRGAKSKKDYNQLFSNIEKFEFHNRDNFV